ncbi:hypothetical protein HYR54_05825 [Candidatus Acetothermia bacterium]|nr:hypothetical protein [Candidatus Acetothermia bacterium]
MIFRSKSIVLMILLLMGTGWIGSLRGSSATEIAYTQPENPLVLIAKVDLPATSIGRGFGGARYIVHACGIWGDGQTERPSA